MKSNGKTFKVGRNAKTGRLVKISIAKKHPKTHIVESMPKAGYGDTK